ncbi:conserved hypothetical protein [Pediculus humanus corporis]|uniref:Mitochondrial nucleoid factor 1 n=1 Tax=Pediculus humanus subsp. corporis TaxID=121224 RepID=E0W0D9_PEDHC|nr:uncharacterized protein Phum_PHUM550750 [Pediculus humanus corporis]EEB19095.1 conserved hypothetical protein [Pediculus humanus corporis]
MPSNYDKLVKILQKWPPNSKRIGRDFGEHLRSKIKLLISNESDVLLNSADFEQKLLSLQRLVDNKYGDKYRHNLEFGATGLPAKDLNYALDDDTMTKFNSMKYRFWR